MKKEKIQGTEEIKERSPFPQKAKEKTPFPFFPVRAEWIMVFSMVLFLGASIFLVQDYGMNIDSQKNFSEGEMNLNYFLTGKVDQMILQWQMHGASIFMAADIAKRLLHDTFHLYDPLAARHILLPFLTAPFMFFLFFFVKRHWSPVHGVISVCVLLTFPYFWGHSFNNLKDVPLLIFFSLSIMSFVDWRLSGKTKFLYRFFIFLGVALSIKTYAFFVPLIVLFWIALKPKDSDSPVSFPPRRIMILHASMGLLIAVVIAISFYAPAFWGVEDKWSFLTFWHDRFKEITWGRNSPWRIYPFVQVFYRTPLMVLALAVMGVFWAVRDYRKSPFYSLLLIWFLIPLIIPCFPHTVIYHSGLRHVFVFLVPYSILAVVGLVQGAGFLAGKLRVDAKTLIVGIASLTIGLNLLGIVTTHPYQTTFFNALAGGLKGAQEKDVADACDYWMNSYKEAGRWINLYGEVNANVLAVYHSALPPVFNTGLIKESIDRADIKTFHLQRIPVRQGRVIIPENTYVVLVPFDYLRSRRIVLERSGAFQKVYSISRQGGEICTIFYKPRGPL
jgi:hypothetical protein